MLSLECYFQYGISNSRTRCNKIKIFSLKIHLTFPKVPDMKEQSGEFDLPLTLFGGRFGKTGNEVPPDEITNDDGISHMVEGGLSLKLRYEMIA